MNYGELQRVLLAASGAQETPSSLLAKWESFVEECEDGYRWDYSEYLNELDVRRHLGSLADASDLEDFPEHEIYLENLARLDERFRALLHSSCRAGGTGDPWWRRGVLRYAGEDYAQYVRKAFGCEVDVVE